MANLVNETAQFVNLEQSFAFAGLTHSVQLFPICLWFQPNSLSDYCCSYLITLISFQFTFKVHVSFICGIIVLWSSERRNHPRNPKYNYRSRKHHASRSCKMQNSNILCSPPKWLQLDSMPDPNLIASCLNRIWLGGKSFDVVRDILQLGSSISIKQILCQNLGFNSILSIMDVFRMDWDG